MISEWIPFPSHNVAVTHECTGIIHYTLSPSTISPQREDVRYNSLHPFPPPPMSNCYPRALGRISCNARTYLSADRITAFLASLLTMVVNHAP